MKKLSGILFVLVFFVICAVLLPTQVQAAEEGGYIYIVSSNEATITGCNASISGDVTIPETLGGYPVVNIKDMAFADNNNLTSITIPDSVTSIGSNVFIGCSSLTSVTIPDSVTSIGYYVFNGCSSLESLAIPFVGEGRPFGSFFGRSSYDGSMQVLQPTSRYSSTYYYIPSSLRSVTVTGGDIPYGAFYECGGLTNITIGNGVADIASEAFYNCGNLTSITIGSGVTSIGENAFYGCTSLTDVYVTDFNAWLKIVFDSSYSYPNWYADNLHLIDAEGKEITELVLDSSVTTIPAYGFSHCRNLVSITIDSGITSIGKGAFEGCTSLTDVYITDINAWCKIEFGNETANPMYYADNLHLIDEEGKEITEEITEIVLDDSVTTIPFYGFKNFKNMTSIKIPNSVTSIGYGAFSGCVELKSIEIPDSVTYIGPGFLYGCSGLESITIPFVGESAKGSTDTYQYPLGYFFGTSAFSGATAVAQSYYAHADFAGRPVSVTDTFYIPNSLKTVTVTGGNLSFGAFSRCRNLTSITILSNATSIENCTFLDCSKLTSIFLPSSIKSIYIPAFVGCSSLKDIYFAGSKSQWESISMSGETYDKEYLTEATKHYDMRIVTFKNWDGTVLGAEPIKEGTVLPVSTPPQKPSDNTYTYTFNGWDQAVCTGDMEVTAQYTATYIDYTVEFQNWDGSVLQTGVYHYGDPVTAPDQPVKPYDETYYYVFTGWDASVSATCDGNKIYTAVYEAHKRSTSPTPETPTVNNFTQTVVILQPVEGCEYSLDGINWQDSNTFVGLKADTQYTFYQRVKETEATFASPVSPVLSVKTAPKAACSVKPVAPIVADYTYNKIVLVSQTGYEYRLNSGAWTTSPTFTGLQANTSYTVYQRIAETEEEFASDASQGMTVKTAAAPTGNTTASRYEQLRQYIYDHATSSNGKVLLITQSQNSANYTYRLTNQNEGITFSLMSEHKGSSGFDITTHFTLYPDSEYINVSCTVSYFSGGKVMDMVNDTISVNRATYTVDTELQSSESGFLYITASDFSGLATTSMGTLCAYWNSHILSNLGFDLEELGFIAFVNGEPSICDIPSGYHAGTLVLRNQWEAGCMIDGYTGDYYCSSCGEKVETGSAIACVGMHSYDNSCDFACNACGEERKIMHTYTSGCDRSCDICGYARIALEACDYADGENCVVCGSAWTTGDIDGNGEVTQDDAVYLLLHTMFGEMFYPLNNAPADIDGSGTVDQEDAVYLLLHTMFGEMFYPLNTPALPAKIKE